ncbi:hypothetical protein [Ruminococcus sp.]|uniref:hypothetical protein n=1 Tax=Ruminococcus sp. TaxID=41978 RepID=UPI0025F1304C|nr:hypothetical protein [Ruminococcus sp.]MBQ6035407.1 hypothetical protein [Ruminococcus sp.]MBQ6250474.1 hypothetical protein [Ruminococcus sp.]
MKSISILGDRNLTLTSIQNMKHSGAVRTYPVSDDRFCAEFPDGHIFFDYDTDLSDRKDELEKLPFQAAAVIMIVYRNAANVRHVLTQPDFPQNVYIDNDFGVLLPLQEYIAAGMPMEE